MDAAAPEERHRTRITRPDGRVVNVARFRGQLFVCATGCCCGRIDDGFPAVSTQLYHDEWERRRLRDIVHLTIGGCLRSEEHTSELQSPMYLVCRLLLE